MPRSSSATARALKADDAVMRDRMIPAPVLPPVTRRPKAFGTAPAEAPAEASLLGVIQAMAEAHEGHIQAMAALHRQFLAQQRDALARLVGRVPAPPPVPAVSRSLPGPKLDRADLEAFARHERSVASLFGPLFARQDRHRYQIRLPAPPLTITDRVLGIEGEPGSLAQGRIWAEYELKPDSRWLDPAGRASTLIMGECGQANMLLASYLGVDLTHDGLHRYRLLDLETTLHGPRPKVGDTLSVEIRMERQAVAGGLRILFLTGDIRVGGELRSRGRFSAGLFTETELANSDPIRWDPAADTRSLSGPFDLPEAPATARSFDPEALAALREGDVAACFGPGFRAHSRPPLAAKPELFLLHEVPHFDPRGGPWGRGYLKAVQKLSPQDWFFAAHFPGDPCVPGFILLEGAVQALAFHLTASGLTLARDGWHFEMVPETTYTAKFRGQIVPQTADLTYEVFVEAVTAGAMPHAVADIICRLEDRTIFHARRLALGLVQKG